VNDDSAVPGVRLYIALSRQTYASPESASLFTVPCIFSFVLSHCLSISITDSVVAPQSFTED